MKDYFIAFVNLIFGNVNDRKGFILLGILVGVVFFYGVFSIDDKNTKIMFAILGSISCIISLRTIFKSKNE
jgi:hypothetical protein